MPTLKLLINIPPCICLPFAILCLRETPVAPTEPNQDNRTNAIGLSTGIIPVVVGIVLIIGVGVTGPA